MGDSEAHLSLIIKAKNLAGGEIGKAQQSLKSLKTGALDSLNLGFLGVAGAAAVLTGALVDGVKGAIEEEAQLKRVQAALKANVPAWNGDLSAITKAVHAREDLGFSDTALRESLIKLVPATHDVNKALDYQQTAMDLARLKGISLEDASQALVKVEGGQYKMLKSLGIVLKEGATQTDALAAVQKVAMGQAAAYADTLAGKTEVLQARFGDLTENIGGLLIPALNDLAESALEVIDVFDTDSETPLEGRLQGLVDVANKLNPATWGMAQAFDGAHKAAAKEADKAFEAARALDTMAEKMADAREAGKDLKTEQDKLNKSLKVTGQEALDIVNNMIDIRREEEYLMKTNKPFRSSMRGTWLPHGGQPPIGPPRAEGGWIGLNGPEYFLGGEQGPEYVVPNDKLHTAAGNGGAGFTIQGVSERDIMDMVDRGLYFRLRRAGTAA